MIRRHLDESGLSYFQHMKRAMSIFSLLSLATLAILIHSLLPFVCENTASDIVKKIYKNYIS